MKNNMKSNIIKSVSALLIAAGCVGGMAGCGVLSQTAACAVSATAVAADKEEKVSAEVSRFLENGAKPEDFTQLSAEDQIAAFHAMSSEQAYNVVAASESSWCVNCYDLVSVENVKDFVIIYPNGDNGTSFNLDWPVYGGYDADTIASISDLSGAVEVSRVGGDGGYTMCYGTNNDGSQYTTEQRALPETASEITTGVLDVDLYKASAEIVTADQTDDEKITDLEAIGFDEEAALNLISDYNNWLGRSEIAGANSIPDGVIFAGHMVDANYGYYGKAAAWTVSNLTLEGGCGQMNTIYSWGTLKSSGLVSDVQTAYI